MLGGATLKLVISRVSGVPIYEQIKIQIKKAIMSGVIKENEMLPSLRNLSKDLKISVLTTTRAYTELEQEGFIKNVQGKGSFVLGNGSELMREHFLTEIEESLLKAIDLSKRVNLSIEELHKMLDELKEIDLYE